MGKHPRPAPIFCEVNPENKPKPVDADDLRKVWRVFLAGGDVSVGQCMGSDLHKPENLHDLMTRCALLADAVERGEVDPNAIDFEREATADGFG